MPPKRKKSVRQKQKQRQSQSQRVTINLNKPSPRKRRTAGRGGLPPPSYQQNLFPPTIIQQQAPNIAVLENQLSRLTSMIQEPIGIKQPATPLSINTRAKTAEAQKMAGEQAEARRPGPTAENFQAPASVARNTLADQSIDAFGNPLLDISSRRSPPPFRQTQQQIISSIVQKAETDRKAREEVAGVMRDLIDKVANPLRPPDPAFNQRLVNPADPPKMGGAGQGEGGGNIPFAESRPLVGRPSKDTQKATPIGTPSAKPTKQQKQPKKEPLSKVAKELKQAAEQPGQQRLDPLTFPPKL